MQQGGKKKRIKGYNVSYSSTQLLGKSLYGELRLGVKDEERKVYVFRINSLPLSEHMKDYLTLQDISNTLTNQTTEIVEIVETQSNRYTVLQYFPKTFKTELPFFQKLTKNLQPYIFKFLKTYSQLYYLRITHGNINLHNIGITFDGNVKLMDFHKNTVKFEEGAQKDYNDFKKMIGLILERDSKFPFILSVLDDEEGSWEKLFAAWHINCPLHNLYVVKNNSSYNMVVMLSKLLPSVQKISPQICIAMKVLISTKLTKMITNTQEFPQIKIYSKQALQAINIDYLKSIIWGVIKDPSYFNFSSLNHFLFICCFLQNINHQFCYTQFFQETPELLSQNKYRLLSSILLKNYSQMIIQNVIQF